MANPNLQLQFSEKLRKLGFQEDKREGHRFAAGANKRRRLM
jgi:hypothetical protein